MGARAARAGRRRRAARPRRRRPATGSPAACGWAREARAAIVARAGGDARGALNLLEAAAAGTGRRRRDRARGGPVGRRRPRRRLRPRGRRPLRHDLGLHQEPARQRSRRRDLLPRGDARRAARTRSSSPGGSSWPPARTWATPTRGRWRWRWRPARAVEFVGLPEARINLAQATTYIALAPKSNASYRAIDAALDAGGARGRAPPAAGAARRERRQRPRPRPRRRATGTRTTSPTRVLDESLLPEGMEDASFYHPTDRGPEGELAARLRRLRGGPRPRGATSSRSRSRPVDALLAAAPARPRPDRGGVRRPRAWPARRDPGRPAGSRSARAASPSCSC